LALRGHHVEVLGAGPSLPDRPYRYRQVRMVPQDRFRRWPSVPFGREPTTYESLTFNLAALGRWSPGEVDVTLTCGFPWDNLFLRRPTLGPRPPHVFVTENGDWPALLDGAEARLFSCDGLVCTNPVYRDRNAQRWHCALIPNGVDPDRFRPGPASRERLGLPDAVPLVLMVSALIPSKRVDRGIEAVAAMEGAHLVVAGDGPLRDEIDAQAERMLAGRYLRRSFEHHDMPDLYRSCDAVLHLTELESFGNVFAEALATARPVVAPRSPVTEWILGDDGVLVDTDSPAVLAAALDEAVTKGGNLAAATAAHDRFGWDRISEEYEAFLEEVVDRRPSPPRRSRRRRR
jgi:glycosyltransferase involved in cell wall biosynthesis